MALWNMWVFATDFPFVYLAHVTNIGTLSNQMIISGTCVCTYELDACLGCNMPHIYIYTYIYHEDTHILIRLSLHHRIIAACGFR